MNFSSLWCIKDRDPNPIYKFLVFAFFSLLPTFFARFAPMAWEGILGCGEGRVLYIYAFPSFLSFSPLSVLALSAACGGTVAVPCFCFGRRYALTKDRPLPLLRFGCFCHRQRLSCAVPHAWEAPLSVSPPLRASRQLSRRESQVRPWTERNFVVRRSFFQLSLTTNFSKTDAGTLASPREGGGTALCAVTERGLSKNPTKRKMPAFAGIFRFMGEVWLACKKFWAGSPAYFTVW